MRLTVLLTVMVLVFVPPPVLAHDPAEHGSNHASAAGVPGDPNAPTRTIEIAMREGDGKMLFAPNTIDVTVGEQVRFKLVNEGEVEHEFVLGTPQEITEHAEMMQAMPDMKHSDPNAARLQPKATSDIVWKFTSAGAFEFACLIPGHREVGMVGRVVVR